MVDSCLIDLEEMIDPPLVSLPFITPSLSSTPRDTTKGALHLLSSPLPIAQCTGLEMGESLRGDASCVCLLYTSPSPRDGLLSRMPSSA